MDSGVKRGIGAVCRKATGGWANRFTLPFLAMAIFACALFAATPAYADALEAPKVKIGNTEYDTLEEAVTAAESAATITLGEGKYTLYKKGAETKGKRLTFVGQGADKTGWNIGAEVPDPDNYGTEYNGDYSFYGAGTITFKNMTLQSGTVDYLGFIRADHTVVDNCVVNGKTFYWGYTSATFINTTFNAPGSDYSLWTYSSPVMTFDGCTFNASGKIINVYTDSGAGKYDIQVNFKNCTVNSAKPNKQALGINDSNMGDYKYVLNIEGVNTINGLNPDSASCSRLFGFGGDAAKKNTGRTDVYIDGKLVWTKGEMVGHEIDTANDKYTDGYEDNAYTVETSDWTVQADGTAMRTVTKKCKYCGWTKAVEEIGYTVAYTDGANGSIFADQSHIVVKGDATPAFDGAPTREGYTFTGWTPEVADTVEQNVTYVAQWKKNATPANPDKPNKPAKPSKGSGALPQTGDNAAAVASVTAGAALAAIAGAALRRRAQ